MSGAWSVCEVELRKLAAQISTRLLVAVCVLGPLLFVLILSVQPISPGDTLFGRWVHTTGFAIPLVVLSFASAWGVPLIAGVIAGDSFASEDRLGTWKTVLTRSRTRGQVFAGKSLAAALASVLLLVALAAVSLAGGLVAVGAHSLVGLSGTELAPGHTLALVAASWGFALVPALGFVSLGLLFSVATRSTAMGVLGPMVVGLAMQLLAFVGKGEIVRMLLLASAFDGWHGLFTEHPFYGPLEQGALVSAGYAVVCTSVAWILFRRRDFAGAQGGRQLRVAVTARWVALAAGLVALLTVASGWGPTGITAARLQSSITLTFNNLVVLQQQLLGRQVPAGARLVILPACERRGSGPDTRGPGDDWHCTLDVVEHNLAQKGVGYDVTVKPDGCYTAEGPPSFVGPSSLPIRPGHSVLNPLFQFDGCFDTT